MLFNNTLELFGIKTSRLESGQVPLWVGRRLGATRLENLSRVTIYLSIVTRDKERLSMNRLALNGPSPYLPSYPVLKIYPELPTITYSNEVALPMNKNNHYFLSIKITLTPFSPLLEMNPLTLNFAKTIFYFFSSKNNYK